MEESTVTKKPGLCRNSLCWSSNSLCSSNKIWRNPCGYRFIDEQDKPISILPFRSGGMKMFIWNCDLLTPEMIGIIMTFTTHVRLPDLWLFWKREASGYSTVSQEQTRPCSSIIRYWIFLSSHLFAEDCTSGLNAGAMIETVHVILPWGWWKLRCMLVGNTFSKTSQGKAGATTVGSPILHE